MIVTVNYTAQARDAAGTASERIDLGAGKTVGELLEKVSEQHGDRLRTLLDGGAVLVVVGDEQVRPGDTRSLKEGDVVSILTPISGG